MKKRRAPSPRAKNRSRVSARAAVARLVDDGDRARRRFATVTKIESRWQTLDDRTGPEALELLVAWVRAQLERTGARGLVTGASGGVDSSLVLALMARAAPKQSHALIMPCRSDAQDEKDARALLRFLKLPFRVIDIGHAVDTVAETLQWPVPLPKAATGNLASRVRNALLYLEANVTGRLVVGTGNLDETYLGYSSKGTTSDLFPITGLHKDEVRALLRLALAKAPALADRIIGRPPTPGYWPGQTAEAELGITYRRVGPALDLIIGHCDITPHGVIPRDPERMEEVMAQLGVPPADVLHVAGLIMKNQHKAFGSPALWRHEPLADGDA